MHAKCLALASRRPSDPNIWQLCAAKKQLIDYHDQRRSILNHAVCIGIFKRYANTMKFSMLMLALMMTMKTMIVIMS